MAVSPPKCRTCGKVEWRHVCGGRRGYGDADILSTVDKMVLTAMVKLVEPTPAPEPGQAKPKTDRKEYLRLKAIERRARQAAEKAAK